MNGGTTEANLAEFFDSYAMALQPQDLTAQLPSSHNALFQPAAVDHELLRQLDRDMIVGNGSSVDLSPAFGGRALPAKPASNLLQAQTFTDVLANVASDWQNPPPQEEAWRDWGSSFTLDATGQWTIAHNSMSQAPVATAHLHTDTRVTPTTDCSSNNSGDMGAVKQEEAMTSQVRMDEGGKALSDVESDPEPAPSRKAAAKDKETPAQRAEQRRTRKREKDRIEELNNAIQKATEDKEQLQAQSTQLAANLQAKDEELRQLRAAEESALPAADDDRLAASFEGNLRLTVQDGRELELTPDQIKNLTEAELIDFWRQYVHRLSILLAAGGPKTGYPQEVVQRVHVLQREAMFLHIRSAIANLAAVKQLTARGRLDGAEDDGSAVANRLWEKVVEGLALAPGQRGMMTDLWRSFQNRIAKLMAVRHSIHEHLCGTIPEGIFGRHFAINFLKAHELMDALKYNLRQEHIVLMDFLTNFSKILTPLQNAGCMVQSWPYFPDTVTIASLVAKGASL